jgi:hypothetical protein
MASLAIVGVSSLLSLTNGMWDEFATMINKWMKYVASRYLTLITKYKANSIRMNTAHSNHASATTPTATHGQWVGEPSPSLHHSDSDSQTPSLSDHQFPTMWDNFVAMVNKWMEYIASRHLILIAKYRTYKAQRSTSASTRCNNAAPITTHGQWISESSSSLNRTVTDLQTPSFNDKTGSLQRKPASTAARHAAGYASTPSIPQDERMAVYRGRVVTEEIKLLQLMERQ